VNEAFPTLPEKKNCCFFSHFPFDKQRKYGKKTDAERWKPAKEKKCNKIYFLFTSNLKNKFKVFFFASLFPFYFTFWYVCVCVSVLCWCFLALLYVNEREKE